MTAPSRSDSQVDDRVQGADGLPLDLVPFLTELGYALLAIPTAVNEVRDVLQAVSRAYGVRNMDSWVLPATLLVRVEGSGPPTIDLNTGGPASLRLDQAEAVYDLALAAERAELIPTDGRRELNRIWEMPARFSPPVRVIGYGILAAGLGLVLHPTLLELLISLALGSLVGIITLAGPRIPHVAALLPVATTFIVSAIVFSLARHGSLLNPLYLLIPPLVTFLPGTTLATSLLELTNGEVVSGASRLVSGSVQVVLLAFGIVAASQVVGLPATAAFTHHHVGLLGPWAPAIGVAVYGLGAYLYFSAQPRSLPWILVVMYLAWITQTLVGGSFLSGFAGAVVMTPATFLAARLGGPSPIVTFLPGFWLLLPGSLALFGVTEIVGAGGRVGLQDFTTTLLTLVSVALGVLVGTGLSNLLPNRPARSGT